MHQIRYNISALVLCLFFTDIVAQETIYPSSDWLVAPANELGIDQQKVDKLFNYFISQNNRKG